SPLAGRLDAPEGRGRVHRPLQARAGAEAGALRGHLRRTRRRPLAGGVPVRSRGGTVLAAAGRSLRPPRRLLRGPRRYPVTPGADLPGVDLGVPARLQCRAIRPGVGGHLDRPVPGADHRAAHHRPPTGRLAGLCPPGASATGGSSERARLPAAGSLRPFGPRPPPPAGRRPPGVQPGRAPLERAGQAGRATEPGGPPCVPGGPSGRAPPPLAGYSPTPLAAT